MRDSGELLSIMKEQCGILIGWRRCKKGVDTKNKKNVTKRLVKSFVGKCTKLFKLSEQI